MRLRSLKDYALAGEEVESYLTPHVGQVQNTQEKFYISNHLQITLTITTRN